MNIAVIGAGAVGCYYGGLLLKAGHDVTFIGRQPHVDAINAHGLLLDIKDFKGHLPARAAIDTAALAAPDLVLVCVKSADTEGAGRSLAGRLRPDTSVLRCRTASTTPSGCAPSLASPSLPVVVYVGSGMAGPGHVRHHGGGGPGDRRLARERRAGANACRRRHQDHDRRRHRDHAVEQAHHQLRLQRAVRGGRHRLRPDDGGRARGMCRSAVQEATDVARACGVAIPEDLVAQILKIPAAMPNQTSSTAQDLVRGKPSEIDFLNGHVVRKGAELGIPTPTNQALQVMVKLAERGKALSGD